MLKDINDCPACGNMHDLVSVNELAVPVNIDDHDYSFWYFCPETGDSVYCNEDIFDE